MVAVTRYTELWWSKTDNNSHHSQPMAAGTAPRRMSQLNARHGTRLIGENPDTRFPGAERLGIKGQGQTREECLKEVNPK